MSVLLSVGEGLRAEKFATDLDEVLQQVLLLRWG
jgi:hypothetical protein